MHESESEMVSFFNFSFFLDQIELLFMLSQHFVRCSMQKKMMFKLCVKTFDILRIFWASQETRIRMLCGKLTTRNKHRPISKTIFEQSARNVREEVVLYPT